MQSLKRWYLKTEGKNMYGKDFIYSTNHQYDKKLHYIECKELYEARVSDRPASTIQSKPITFNFQLKEIRKI
ncbi:hypothetical protein RCL_jg21142.t1 [Rhizophagus clarus]|uniref:Uncharacterized protein n=1 Tax=Rhizophagus clarus TaxID=94130 RepID=A0A8H3LY34_9GLOM|nr:hypothetical protein RCL_jg21142.t1 [Rhizophagus clarus]